MNTLVIVLCWILIAFYAWSVSLVILSIGKPKKPTTPGVALFSIVFAGFLIFALAYSALHL
jgi:hypothetical protein